MDYYHVASKLFLIMLLVIAADNAAKAALLPVSNLTFPQSDY